MTSTFRYFEIVQDHRKEETPTDLFFVQSELLTKHIDLSDKSVKNCCRLTITDLTDYWQCTVTRDLLLSNFTDDSALIEDARDRVLTEALNGAHYEGTAPYSLAAVKESNKIKIILKTYFGKVAFIAGSFFADPVDKAEYNSIEKAWFINSSKASQAALEAEVAHAQEIKEVKENLDDLRETVQRMNRESFEYKLSMFSNFAKVLDTKKTKIKDLQYANEDLQRRKRSIDETKEEEQDPAQITQSLTQSFNKSQKRSGHSSDSSQRTSSSSQRLGSSTQRRSTQRESTLAYASQETDYNSQSARQNTVKLESSFSIAKEISQPSSSIDLTQSDDEEDPPSSLPPIAESVAKSGYLTDDYESDEDLYAPEPTI